MRQLVFLFAATAVVSAQFGFGGLGGDEGGLAGSVGGALQGKVSQLRNITKAATGCFTNEHGFKCCSRVLNTFLSVTFKVPLVESLLDALDLQKSVNTILGMVQDNFGTSFEIVLSPGDFASKNTFRGDLMCKTKTPQGKVIIVYATPVPYSTAQGENRPLSEKEIKEKGWSNGLLESALMDFVRRYYTNEETDAQWQLRIWRTATLVVLVVEGFFLIWHVANLIIAETHHEDWKNPVFVTSGCLISFFFLLFGITCCRCDNFFIIIHLFCYQIALTIINISLLVSIVISLIYYRQYFVNALKEYLIETGSHETVLSLLLTESAFLFIWFIYRFMASVTIFKYWRVRREYKQLIVSYAPVSMDITVY